MRLDSLSLRTVRQVLVHASILMAVIGLALVFNYVLFGHGVIRTLYDSDLSIVDRIMSGKAETPLQGYFAAVDRGVLVVAVCFIMSSVGLVILANPLGAVFSGLSFLAGSLAIFLVLDLFPALVRPLHFDMIPYFNYRLTYMPDPVLGFRERPNHRTQISNFRGFGYSPLYGINERPHTLVWQTDEEGFRNNPETRAADVAVIGSSFPEYGTDLEDTYPKKLEENLGGHKVVNLAKAGYGPFEFLKVLERYALDKKPHYVLFAFNAAGDTNEHLADWVQGRKDGGVAKRSIAFGGFFPRYGIALGQTWRMVSSSCWTALQVGLNKIVGTEFVHPDVAVLKFPNGVSERMVFIDHHSSRSTEDLLRSPEWRALENILREFKRVSERNDIVPIMVYLPTETEVYAQYTTRESGANWLSVRDSQIATSGNSEAAARKLADKLGIELISFLPAFQDAALHGKLVYYRLDSHWNTEGREIAATITAERLKSRLDAKENAKKGKSKTLKKPSKPYPGTQQVSIEGNESIIARTIDGKINSWNSRAEELYGWKKEEALGQVSHSLLKTKFPEPLDQIDAELMQNGRWEGKLVHATRDGRRIVVQSRWILDSKGRPGAVVEINTRSADS
jgi:PAS domain S-box-containing protein